MNERQPQKLTVLYLRLSKDDFGGDNTPSNSIVNQQRMLTEYAERNGFVPYVTLSDDGRSGTNFQRPGWSELMELVEADKVGAIILKSLDRMGRNYLEAGMLREMFAEKGIRLIAINDGVDTFDHEDDFTPFREIIAEHYARDTSRKIKSVLKNKGRDGKPLGSVPLYGFKKDLNDKNVRIIDDEAASVVRRMFEMTVAGMGPYQIAKTFMDENIERPSYYLYRAGIVTSDGKCNHDLRYNWRGNTVMEMLQKREYMGDLVNFKTNKPSFKSKKQVANAPEDILIFEGALPQIIDRPTWELAQKCRRTVRRVAKGELEPNPLTGLLFCADCGGKLHNRRSNYTEDKNGNPIYPVDTYECTNYRNNATKFVDTCSIHFIRSVAVREIILAAIRNVSKYALGNESDFVAKLREASTLRQQDAAKSHKRTIAKNEKRIAELDRLFIRTYEDNTIGKLSDKRFNIMTAAYESEQAELKAQTTTLTAELEAFEQDSENADRFMALVRRYTQFDELTNGMLLEFVDRVMVHEADKSSGERTQQVDVYLNFIGDFKIPGTEPKPLTPEEQAAEEKRLAEKRRKNENLRAWRAKRKAEKKVQALQPSA
jgi:DNA invertase Pin-like site-specific DNA recombinase